MKTALTIAGSDSSGGAGIQADLKTFTTLGVYGMSVITAVTAQNTCKVFAIENINEEIVRKQLDAVFNDIRPDSIKIGMTSSSKIIEVIAERLSYYKAQNIVLDPVLISTSGTKLLDSNAITTLQKKLFPLSELITPNIPEGEVISGLIIQSKKEMEIAAKKIFDTYGCKVLLKGGHRIEDSCDYFFDGTKGIWFEEKKIDNPNTHGTGCTLSSAICANLALEKNISDSIYNAKQYISNAISAMLDLGKGSGPLNQLNN